MDQQLKDEIDRNFDFFQRTLAGYLIAYAGRYALLRRQTAVEFFDRPEQADRAGAIRFPDGLYSIQRVVTEPVELGLFSDAAH